MDPRHIASTADTKTCSQCQNLKQADEFYQNAGKPMNPCKVCRKDNTHRGLVGLKRIGGAGGKA